MCEQWNAQYLYPPFWLTNFLVVDTFLLVEFSESTNCSAQCVKEIVF